MPNASLNASRWAPASSRTTHTNSHNYSQPSFTPPTTNTTRSVSPISPPPAPALKLTRSQKLLQHKLQNHHKFIKLLRRLTWKSTALLFCHHRALQAIHKNQHYEKHEQPQDAKANPLDRSITATEAKTMFKIDFFEFYVLLERLLVHLLEIFGITVSTVHARDIHAITSDGLRAQHAPSTPSTAQSANEPPTSTPKTSLVGDSLTFGGYSHRFHANVLSALDLDSNPIHPILGIGVVRDYLGIAKEFRNRWKDAEEKAISPADSRNNHHDDDDAELKGSRYERMTEDLKLEEMLREILAAVDRCKAVAEAELARAREVVQSEHQRLVAVAGADTGMTGPGAITTQMTTTEVDMLLDIDGYGHGYGHSDKDSNGVGADSPWEAMPDAMEWD